MSPADASINEAIAGRLGDAAATWKKAAAEARAKDKAGFDRAEAAIRKARAAPGPDARRPEGRRVRALGLSVENFTEAPGTR